MVAGVATNYGPSFFGGIMAIVGGGLMVMLIALIEEWTGS